MSRSLSQVLLVALLLALLWAGCGCTEKSLATHMSDNQSSRPTEMVLEHSMPQPMMTLNPMHTSTPTPIPTSSPVSLQEPVRTPSSTPSQALSTPLPVLIPVIDPSVFKDITIWYTRVTYTYSEGKDADDRKTATELWKVQGDGSGRQKLFSKELEGEWNVSLRHLVLSHDGQKLAFIQIVDKRGTSRWSSSLWLANTGASELKEVISKSNVEPGSPDWSEGTEIAFLNKERPMFPAWSPDDSLLAFVDYIGLSQGLPGTVCALDVRNGQWDKLAEGDVFTWSPDSSVLAVYTAHHRAAVHDLQFVDLKGESRSIVKLPASLSLDSLDWSASAQLITAQGVNYELSVHPILMIRPFDGGSEIIVKNGCLGCTAKWSPDGRMILFKRHIGDTATLYIIDRDSGDTRSVMPKTNVTSEGVWSPDSRYILIQSEVEGNGLYIISVANGQYWKIPNLSNDSRDVWFSSYDWLFAVK